MIFWWSSSNRSAAPLYNAPIMTMRAIPWTLFGFLFLVQTPIINAAQDATATDGEDAPQERGLRQHLEGAFDGYTLFSPLASTSIYLIDMKGEIAHEWKTELSPTGAVYLLDNGHVLRCATQPDNPKFNGGGMGGRIQEFDWDGNLVWDFELANDYQTQHHDIEPMPDGNVLLITWEHRFPDDAVEWGRDPAQIGEDGLWPDAVLEIKPTGSDGGEVVWEWHAWDHVVQDFDEGLPGHGSVPENPGRIDINADHRDQPAVNDAERERLEQVEQEMRALGYMGDDDEDEDSDDGGDGATDIKPDWLHTNGIDYHPGLDLIALSSPEMNEVWVIDHSTTTDQAAWSKGGRWKRGGNLLYRWGNPRNYGMGSDDDRRLFYQHNPEWILDGPAGELRLSIFNNGGGRPDGDYSSVIELSLPFDPERGFLRDADAAFGPAQPAWSYSAPGEFYSSFISGAQRLPNGNTLICSGAPGRLIEVTSAGEIVWEYLNTFGGGAATPDGTPGAPPKALFRATRIAFDHPGVAGRLQAR
ncbi:MAG: hypothetical protein ACI8QZ_002270 [Chlamydiales bacterium]|jgi:hypothetical protein